LNRLTRREPIAVDVQANARDICAGQVDFSNAAGCFTLQFSTLVHAGNSQANRARLGRALQDLRDGLRAHLIDPFAYTGRPAEVRLVYQGAGFSEAAPALGRSARLADGAPFRKLH
jgi:hypothetical protein